MQQRTPPAPPDPSERSVVDAEPRRSGWRAVWDLPLWVHGALLATILAVLIPVVGVQASFSADEGAAIVQARSLADGDGWIVEHPLDVVDPEDEAYPIELGLEGADGVAPFAKHPVFALALAGAAGAADVAGMVGLSVLGTIAAALAGAALARRIDPALARPTLWTVGLFTPLLFDAYLVMGHTLGAALCAAATLAVVAALARDRPLLLVAAGAAMLGATLVRREALLYAVALTLVGAALTWSRDRRLAAMAGAAPLAGALVGTVVSSRLSALVVGSSVVETADPADRGWSIGGQVDAFVITWLEPATGGTTVSRLFLVAAVIVAVVGALDLRRGEGRLAAPLFALGAALVVARVVLFGSGVVPGLVLAMPFLVPAALLVDRRVLADRTVRLCAATSALFALGVLATQWSKGGGAEWGGRFFALGLPVAVPVLLAAGREAIGRLDASAARLARGAFVVSGVAMAVLAVSSLRSAHDGVARLIDRVDDEAIAVGPPGDGDDERAVVVATRGLVPRFAWDVFDDHRWLLVDANSRQEHPEELDRYLGRLADQGFDRVLLVTRDWDDEREVVERHYDVAEIDSLSEGSSWSFVTLERPGS